MHGLCRSMVDRELQSRRRHGFRSIPDRSSRLRSAVRRMAQRLVCGLHVRLYELSGGAIGGRVGRAPVLLLTTRGRRTGRLRKTPLLYATDGDRLLVVASNGGAPRHPAWFLNLEANPEVEAQVRSQTKRLRARAASAEERERYWPLLLSLYPRYATYRSRTSREIPLVVLEPRG
jgi:deazaflavin-dependent oxidoreductase (nitroreductase family)